MSGPTRPPTPSIADLRAELIDFAGRKGGTAGETWASALLSQFEAAVREDERRRQRERFLDWLQGDGPFEFGPVTVFDPSDGASVDPVADPVRVCPGGPGHDANHGPGSDYCPVCGGYAPAPAGAGELVEAFRG